MHQYLVVLLITTSLMACRETDYSFVLPRDLPESWPASLQIEGLDSSADYELVHEASGQTFASQWNGGKLVFLPSIAMKIGEVLQVTPATLKVPQKMRVEVTDSLLQVFTDSREILTYHLAVSKPPDTLPRYYQRSGFIHPLKSPKGEVLTADFPPGHAHQHGLFHAFVNTKFRGTELDFWNQAKEQGTVRHRDLVKAEAGAVFSRLELLLEQVAFLPEDTVVVLEEEWGLNVFDLGGHYVIDVQIDVSCPAYDSLLIDQYHYGGFAFRGTDKWNAGEAAYDSLVYFITSERKSHIEANHSRPDWVAMYGQLTSGLAGVTMMGYPENYRYPQPVRIHPSMPYFCFAPMVLGPYAIKPEETHSNKYRIVVFDGEPNQELIQGAWKSISYLN